MSIFVLLFSFFKRINLLDIIKIHGKYYTIYVSNSVFFNFLVGLEEPIADYKQF